MRLGRKNVVTPQPLVEVDGGVYLLHDLGDGLAAKRPPHMVLVIAVEPGPDEVSGKT